MKKKNEYKEFLKISIKDFIINDFLNIRLKYKKQICKTLCFFQIFGLKIVDVLSINYLSYSCNQCVFDEKEKSRI